MDDAFPKPSPLLKVVSMMVIGGCLLMFSMVTGTAIAYADSMAYLGAGVVGFTAFTLAIQQYRGTFRGVFSGAVTVCFMLCGTGAILVGLLVLWVPMALLASNASIEDTSIIVLFGLLGGLGFIIGVINGRWASLLRKASDAQQTPPQGLSVRELLLLTTVVAVVTGMTVYVVRWLAVT